MSPRARTTAALLLTVSLLASGCARASKSVPPAPSSPQVQAASAPTTASDKQLPTRKVIRKAELRLQSDDLARSQQAASTMAERLGGFVLSTDARHDADEGAEDDHALTTMVVRVPAEHFGDALAELRKMGSRVDEEKISGEDVTDQYVDLEARLKVETAFEERLLGLLKDARNVKDELEVEKQIAEVRNEIERVEGRRRLLADQASLSTFTVTFTRRMPITSAAATGLGETFRRASSDAVTLFWAILRGAIRVTGVLIPLALLVGLPAYLALRLVRTVRSVRRRRQLTS